MSLSAEVVEALRTMAAADGTTQTEQLRRAISTQKWLNDVTARGGHVLVEEANGRVREVCFLH